MKHSRSGFTLVEIMIVVLIIGIILGIATPQWVRARENSNSKSCIGNLRTIRDAKESFAMEQNKKNGDAVTITDLSPYIKASGSLNCPASGDSYDGSINQVGENPTCPSPLYAGHPDFPHVLP